MWHGGKGSGRRPAQIKREEEDLRWELWQTEDQARKEEIRKQLKLLQEEKNASKQS